ncbi:pollen receptor-like kinase 4 [Malania oleifera]|uniref:pollen receptor-like kinase 4 n=1 Tax=Malania oleifera TaxID=397392 RepID=UPI0025ADB230|nr:pollen receptor-like kinase 4 [Malania oleifera]
MGAHAALLVRPPSPSFLLFTAFLILSCTAIVISSDASLDSETLLKFKNAFGNPTALGSWMPSTTPCNGDNGNWAGVLCWKGNIWGLQLENMGLTGVVAVDFLVPLTYLRTLSFMNNNLSGSFPDLRKLPALKSLYLSKNQFSGEIPDDAFVGMNYLKKVFMAKNAFTGKIPSSLVHLPRLLELNLEGNHFDGSIPDFRHKGLKMVNVSNNQLEGEIPTSLSKMDTNSFSGNKGLCGLPLEPCSNVPSPSPTPGPPPLVPTLTEKPSSSRKAGTIGIIFVLAVALATVVIFVVCFRRAQASKLDRSMSLDGQPNLAAISAGNQVDHHSQEKAKKSEQGKLTFVREDRERFDMQDMLRASAEVLGSGNFGASYKAAVFGGQAVVVKRFKLMNNVGREEFQEHMRRLGRLRHQNLLPLVAYYYRKEEKLLVFDFVQNGSLASHLHGNHTVDRPALEWPARLKIIKGVVKGMAYLYSELPSLMLPHGHLKSSNVLLNEFMEPLLTDYALVPLINAEDAQQLMVAYKSPEYAQLGRTLKKTDVWSLGILILEVLTGKFPAIYLTQGGASGTDLTSWVESIAREESAAEVFDKEMGDTKNAEGEMKKLLKIGLACCEEDVERRWELREAVEKVEELKERDYEDETDLIN